MDILADTNGKILGVGKVSGAAPYTGVVPADFMDTFGLGKYIMQGGVVTAVVGWVAPPIVKVP